MTIDRLALDRASVRSFDADGRLRVAATPISKANVCPYYGREIPGSEALGLDPDRVYYLLRDPEELARAAPTFNNIPLLNIHIPVSAIDPQKEYVVGTTGSEAIFDGTYLQNSLAVWDGSAIAGIESHEQKELSSAYRYRADMTPGEYEGVKYDGVMRDIVGNHVALVEAGRAGPDVVVGDSQPLELQKMAKADKKLAALKPFLAQDADMEALKRLLALDAEEEKKAEDEDDEEEDKKDKKVAEDEDDEDKKDDDKDKKAEDEDDDEEDDDKPAMDAALIRRQAKAEAMSEFTAIRNAEAAVKPLVGDVAAMDSATEVYRFALDSVGVKTKGIHPSALPAMVEMAKLQKSDAKPKIAMDRKGEDSFATLFPNATKLKRS